MYKPEDGADRDRDRENTRGQKSGGGYALPEGRRVKRPRYGLEKCKGAGNKQERAKSSEQMKWRAQGKERWHSIWGRQPVLRLKGQCVKMNALGGGEA